MLLYVYLSSNAEVYIPDVLRHRVKAAYAIISLGKKESVEKVELHVYWTRNGTFGISDMVLTGTDPAVGPLGPSASMAAAMGQTILVWLDMVEQTQVHTYRS